MAKYLPDGTRIGLEDGKPDIVFYGKELQQISAAQQAIQNDTQKMAQQIADQNRFNVRKFLLEILKAVIISAFTLAIEHAFDILAFFKQIFQK